MIPSSLHLPHEGNGSSNQGEASVSVDNNKNKNQQGSWIGLPSSIPPVSSEDAVHRPHNSYPSVSRGNDNNDLRSNLNSRAPQHRRNQRRTLEPLEMEDNYNGDEDIAVSMVPTDEVLDLDYLDVSVSVDEEDNDHHGKLDSHIHEQHLLRDEADDEQQRLLLHAQSIDNAAENGIDSEPVSHSSKPHHRRRQSHSRNTAAPPTPPKSIASFLATLYNRLGCLVLRPFMRLRPQTSIDNNNSLSSIQKVGNMYIFLPAIWQSTGWGCMGPHWFGPLIVIGLTVFSGVFFTQTSWNTIGPITSMTCIMFTLFTLYQLINTAYRDPGVVTTSRYTNFQQQAAATAAQEAAEQATSITDPSSASLEDKIKSKQSKKKSSRYCDYCKAYQPYNGAHCLDCNVCITGYDHHCVWMGTCIGHDNYRQFVTFNLTWLFFLGYALVWVTWLGPKWM